MTFRESRTCIRLGAYNAYSVICSCERGLANKYAYLFMSARRELQNCLGFHSVIIKRNNHYNNKY